MSAPQPPRAAVSSARYERRELIARGGMSSIERAFDRMGQREVAYKRLHVSEPAARRRAAALFQSEYETLKRLVHPNIVEVFEFGYDEAGPYYTMELLSGSDLLRLSPLPVSEACRVLRDVASALALVHARRLLHRDVSPNNVRLTAQGRAKLIDFGALTPFGVQRELVGTPPFIAPECLGDAPIDQRADLYALGALAYFCLTGKTHSPARTLADLRLGQLPPCSPGQHVPELPKALDDLVLALLDPDPLARPASAAEVMEHLTSIASLPPERDALRVAASYLQHPPLVGRGALRHRLQQALAAALGGTGQVLLLEGERGVGKSALLEQLAIEAQLAGALVLRSAGGASGEPFKAVRELVQAGVGLYPDLAPAQPQAASVPVRSAIDASEQQTSQANALQASLLALCERSPLALVLDDAHALDLESLALLASLAEPLRTRPMLLVLGALGSTQPSAALAHLAGAGERLSLPPLGEREIAEIVRGMFGEVLHSAQLARFLYERTNGNPAHALDIVRGLLARGAIRYAGGTFTLPHELRTDIESSYADAELGRLAGASPLAQRAARLLAAHPGSLSAEQVARSLAEPTPEVLRALEELCKGAVAARRTDSFTCHSESLRQAIARTLTQDEHRQAHSALAQVLRAEKPRTLDAQLALVRHCLQAGDEDARAGAELLLHLAETHRFQVAMRHDALPVLEQALTLLQARGQNDRQCMGLLVPLSLAGFYGRLELQRRYLDRTLSALSALCGVSAASKLARRVGPRAGLYLGLAYGFFANLLRTRSQGRRPFVELLQALMSIVVPATAAAASTFDPIESFRIVGWLAPFAAAPERSGMYLVREFCLATAELIAGRIHTATRRYDRVREIFERPVFGVDAMLREQGVLGSLHGTAQGMATDCDPRCLALADELERRGPFYAPHAESVRMTHRAFRGESQLAELHMQRAESLAFQGSTAWSAISVLCGRSVQAYVLTGNVIGLMHVMADLERMASLSPAMAALAELARGHLLLMRGQLDEAIEIYERVLDTRAAQSLCTYPLERALHLRALGQRGDYAAARARAHALFAFAETAGAESDVTWRLPRQELALIEAHLGEHARALELLDSCLAHAAEYQSPLALGAVHRDYVRVYALAGDAPRVAEHLALMEQHFRATHNPWLIQQHSVLRAKVAQLGLIKAARITDAPALAVTAELHAVTQTALDLETALDLGRATTERKPA